VECFLVGDVFVFDVVVVVFGDMIGPDGCNNELGWAMFEGAMVGPDGCNDELGWAIFEGRERKVSIVFGAMC